MKNLLMNFSMVALNSNDATDIAVFAANDRAITGEEWEQITPWGNFPNEKGLQHIDKPQGAALVAAYNSLPGKAKNALFGLPIFVGHPDVDPKRYPDDRRIGKLVGLECRQDGLYGKPAWNDIGARNIEQGYHLYPSAVWRFRRVGNGVIEPTELVSVGLTNTPNIPGVQPWAKNNEDGDGALASWAHPRAAGASGAGNLKAKRVRELILMRRASAANTLTEDRKTLKDYERTTLAGHAAIMELSKKTNELVKAGHNPHHASLIARTQLPKATAIADEHRERMAEKAKEDAFIERVYALMKDANLSYRDAYIQVRDEDKKKEVPQQP